VTLTGSEDHYVAGIGLDDLIAFGNEEGVAIRLVGVGLNAAEARAAEAALDHDPTMPLVAAVWEAGDEQYGFVATVETPAGDESGFDNTRSGRGMESGSSPPSGPGGRRLRPIPGDCRHQVVGVEVYQGVFRGGVGGIGAPAAGEEGRGHIAGKLCGVLIHDGLKQGEFEFLEAGGSLGGAVSTGAG